ncbi:endonuclease/exonuclease/phosphatase family domain-containing protein 1-like [Entelurus aequoreus]|uniref:endonuclease/exonuclease/phosphatase family domain-containing protein 1-like n=1 Tax=Entelurus aequoreus TaxID=161455 RepID=UPI002B1D014F|nr:endonuclease/exonuclease/phosphatase family domain-containing protein 1-like [Entelurus aequoreus]XP_061884793.1 endonuclease/exonuclease/phosphatase family domain-containing protein 1-like [Entelurus aequoreus]
MGGSLGCHRSIPRDPGNVSGKRRKLSAACNFGSVLVRQERLNINAASEEELMTLPGVDRTVARSIVQYRDCIGGFKKVEDLALVSGVGAAKLEAVKVEICVWDRGSWSRHSPSSPRKDRGQQPGGGLDVNTATPAQLMSVPGITEEIARSIVRDRPFRSTEDLLRVKHISHPLQVSLVPSFTDTNGRPPHTTRLHPGPTSLSLKSDTAGLPPGGPAQVVPVRASAQTAAVLRHRKCVVRVATWSLQKCSCDKANNPGVKEVVCMTLLENDIKLLAVQDMLEKGVLQKFCAELNQGTLASVGKWKRPRGVWKCLESEEVCCKEVSYSGFLWDSTGVQLLDAALLESAKNCDGASTSFLAHFSISSHKVAVVNVHMRPTVGKKQSAGVKGRPLSAIIQETLKGEKEVVVLGDFGRPPQSAELDFLRKEKMSALLAAKYFTNISTTCPQGTHCLDNIWLSRSLKKIYSGHCTVVREGLTNPWIPDNWSWGGVASDHCPVVADFSADAARKRGGGPGISALEPADQPKHER